MKTFDFRTPYTTYKNCELHIGTYSCDPLCMALQIMNEEDGPITTLSVNLGPETGNMSLIRPNQAFIDTNNNTVAEEWLQELELAEPYQRFGEPVVAYSGWCAYPLYEFNIDKLKEYDPIGWETHLDQYTKNWEKVRDAIFGD